MDNIENISWKISGLSFKENDKPVFSHDNQLILEKVARIIMTRKGERVNNPEFGSLLENQLFQRANLLPQHINKQLSIVINKYEPRVEFVKSNIYFNKEEATVKIELRRRDTGELLTLEEYLEI